MEYDAIQRKMSKREGEIEQLKFERDEYRAQGKNLNNEIKNLKAANQILDRKLKAEQAERMSMSNASYISNAGLGAMAGRFGGGAKENAKDILSRSIMDASMHRPGNTSIMDINSGFARGNN